MDAGPSPAPDSPNVSTIVVGNERSFWFDADGGAAPEDGDFLLNPKTGTCYLVDRSRASPSKPGRFNLRVTRLEQHAVAAGDPGVILMEWRPR
jgi:hypothetical protein